MGILPLFFNSYIYDQYTLILYRILCFESVTYLKESSDVHLEKVKLYGCHLLLLIHNSNCEVKVAFSD